MRPHELTLLQAATRIGSGESDTRDYLAALIARHDELEERLHVMEFFDPAALLAGGSRDGPLLGAPLGVKDIFDCAGLPTGNGVRDGARTASPAETDSVCVRRLIAAGARVFGKTVTTERAFLDPGPTRNPWNPAHTPGGSSSGSAAGTAAGYFPAAIGSQTAGSVVRPAAYCGVLGMTLSHGRVPMDGVLSLAPSFDTVGFFARDLADLAFLADVLCPGELGRSRSEPERDSSALGFARADFLPRLEEDAARVTLDRVSRLEAASRIRVDDFAMPPAFDDFKRAQPIVFAREAALVHRQAFERDPSRFAPKISALVERGLGVDDAEYGEALESIDRLREELIAGLGSLDAIVLPSATGGAPEGLESTGDPCCNAPWTAVGFPAITLPIGLSDRGLPIGLQIVGRPGGEIDLLRCAVAVSEALDYGCPPPPI